MGTGYIMARGEWLFKSNTGKVHPILKIILFPFFLFSQFINAIARAKDKEPMMVEVENGIYLGRRVLLTDIPLLKEENIEAIVDVTAEFDAAGIMTQMSDFQYLNIPVFDHNAPRLGQLNKAVHWIDVQRRSGKKVLIHCALGQGRSVTVLLGYLLFKSKQKDLHQLIEQVTEKRPTVNLKRRQLRLLVRYKDSEFVQKGTLARLIINPTAGKHEYEKTLQQIKDELEPYLRLQVHKTGLEKGETAKDLAKQAVTDQVDLIIAAGGDGTVNEVASVLIDGDIPLGIIPLGTANALAVCLYGPKVHLKPIETCCEWIVRGAAQKIDTALVNDIPMILLAGLGYEQGMVEKADRELKNKFGAFAYMVAGWKAITENKQYEVKMVADGKEHTFITPSLVVANAAPATSIMAQGGGEPVLDDGKLDITWMENVESTPDGVMAVMQLFANSLIQENIAGDIHHIKAAEIKIDCEPPVNLVVDGENVGETPVHIRVKPSSLKVITMDTPIENKTEKNEH